MRFVGTLKEREGGRKDIAILGTASSTDHQVESATLVAPGRQKLIIIKWTVRQFRSAGRLSPLFLKLLCQCFLFWMC